MDAFFVQDVCSPTTWKDWEGLNKKWGRDKDAVMQQSGVVSESERAVEDKEGRNNSQRDEDNLCTAVTLHLCYISLLLLPWVTCDKSAVPNDFLLIYILSAAPDPTELEHIESAPAGVLQDFTLVLKIWHNGPKSTEPGAW